MKINKEIHIKRYTIEMCNIWFKELFVPGRDVSNPADLNIGKNKTQKHSNSSF